MNARMLIGATTLAVLALNLGGCPSLQTQQVGEVFQGGSSPVQATAKFAQGKLGELNPDDVQLLPQIAEDLSQTFPQIEDFTLPEVTDDQAQAVVDFFDANNVETFEDLEAVIHQAEEDPTSIVIPESAIAVLEELVGQELPF